MAKFICGCNETDVTTFDGRTISDARNGLRQALNISDDMRVLLNSNEVSDIQTVVRADDEIEWVRQGGVKGN